MTVRVNNDPHHLADDLEAVVHAGLAAIGIPQGGTGGLTLASQTMLVRLSTSAGWITNVKTIAVIESFAIPWNA